MTTNNLIAGRAQSLKKAWSLVLKGVVWAEFKYLAGVVLIISRGPVAALEKLEPMLCVDKKVFTL